MRTAAILIGVTGLAAAMGLYTLNSFNHFSEIERSFAGVCTPVTGIAGPEDIQVDYDRQIAYISSRDRRADAARGAIYAFEIENPLGSRNWKDLTEGALASFKPLGLDYFQVGETRRLFVVNEAANTVELFDIDEEDQLHHVDTFSERRLTSPNNVVAVGPTSFYVTNDAQPGRNSRMGNIHFLTRRPSGQVLFTDGSKWRVAAEGLRFANGIEVSSDGGRIFVAETSGRTVKVYLRDSITNVLTLETKHTLSSAPDNLIADPHGGLWVAALPKPLTIARHGANPKNHAPSEIINISNEHGRKTVYLDDGGELSAASAAARIGDTLIIGSVYEKKFLLCKLPRTTPPL